MSFSLAQALLGEEVELPGSATLPIELPRHLRLNPLYEIPMIRVEAPVVMPEWLTNVEKARALAQCYRATSLARTGVVSRVFSRGEPEKWKAFRTLVEAANLMVLLAIPPAAWSGYSFDRYAVLGVGKYPTQGWCWSVSRLKAFSALDMSLGRYCRPRQVMAPLHRALVYDWNAMCRAEEDATCADHWFPGGSFEVRLAQARREAAELQREVDYATRRGGTMAFW